MFGGSQFTPPLPSCSGKSGHARLIFSPLKLDRPKPVRFIKLDRLRDAKPAPEALVLGSSRVRVLAPGRAPRLLTTLPQKLRLIEAAGIDLAFVAPFTPEWAYPRTGIEPDLIPRIRMGEGVIGKAAQTGEEEEEE